VIQVALLVIASPYVTAAVLPDLLGREALAALGARPAEPRRDGPAGGKESTPAGGFIQVYSYEELAGTLRKSPGLEGFIIASGEGLVVWRDLPLRVDAESLVARATELVREAGAMVGGGGMNRLRRLMIETKDHLVVVAPLNQHFELLLVFSGRVPAEEALGRVPLALRSTREFLMWKYADLAMAPAISGDRVMVDFA
jgi:predicted regulator of Ras-like GTPase activity (Roadblock/LC7/MglB family)